MSSKYKLGNLVTPKAATFNKFSYHKPPQKQPRLIRYVTLDNTVTRPSYPAVVNRLSGQRRNLTENSKYEPVGASIHLRSKVQNKRKNSFSNSKSVNLKSISHELQPSLNQSHQNQLNRQDKFAAMREQKIGRLKNLYSLKNSKGHRDRDNSLRPNAKINSFGQLPTRKDSEVNKQKMKSKLFFNKKEEFHYKPSKMEMSERYLPKYLDYCQNSAKSKPQLDQLSVENELPQRLKQEHIIGKIKSINQFPETPPLIPITFKAEQSHEQLTMQWFMKSYQPHLEIFEDVSLQGFKMSKTKNGVYFGQTNPESGEPEGRGVIFYENGKIFEGNFKGSLKEGLGYEEYPDHSFYLGCFSKGRREGKGKFQWSNGEVYDGEWKDNKKSGSGIWKGPNNLSYVGEWQHDSIEGFGVLIETGFRYEGQFKNFMKWGKGTLRFESGETYTGMFKQNLPNGLGDYYWTNQDHYYGQFANGKRHGEGILKYSNGGVYKGLFQNDKKSGQGQQYYEDNLLYEGQFENDLRHGWGVLSCDKKIIFQGYWINNSAVDPKKGTIQPIIEEEASIFQKDTSKNSMMKRHQSNISQMRSKHMAKKQSRHILKISKSKQKQQQSTVPKKFQRACNCERHRRKRLQIEA